MSKLSDLALEKARANIGAAEVGENWGDYVKKYLASVGLYKPAPWCSAFVTFRVKEAAKALGIHPKYIDIKGAGLVQNVVNWAKKNGAIREEPKSGYLFAVWHKELNRYAHIGFVDKISKGSYTTVEGNSNEDGSREGKKVASNRKKIGDPRIIFMEII